MDGEKDADERRRLGMWIAVVAAVLLAGLVAWVGFAAHQRAQVHVFFDALPVACDAGTTTVENVSHMGDEARFQTFVDATENVDCRVRFHVENRGRVAVTVRRVVLPFYGATTGASLQAVFLSPPGVEPLAEDEDGFAALDAVFPSDYRLEPSQGVEFGLHLRFKPDGCMEPDSSMTLGPAPVVEVDVLGLAGDRAPATTLFTQRGTPDSDCSPNG